MPVGETKPCDLPLQYHGLASDPLNKEVNKAFLVPNGNESEAYSGQNAHMPIYLTRPSTMTQTTDFASREC